MWQFEISIYKKKEEVYCSKFTRSLENKLKWKFVYYLKKANQTKDEMMLTR